MIEILPFVVIGMFVEHFLGIADKNLKLQKLPTIILKAKSLDIFKSLYYIYFILVH